MLVDLGGGMRPHPRADVVIDLSHPKNSPAQDATVTPWQVDPGHFLDEGGQGYLHSELVDEVFASHFLEHINPGAPLIRVMNEAWRVLKPGGTFTFVMPIIGYTEPTTGAYMQGRGGWRPWADPTHVNFWWLPEGVEYFTPTLGADADYGLSLWEPLGGWVSEAESFRRLDAHKAGVVDCDSWWSVRNGWEGCGMLVKP